MVWSDMISFRTKCHGKLLAANNGITQGEIYKIETCCPIFPLGTISLRHFLNRSPSTRSTPTTCCRRRAFCGQGQEKPWCRRQACWGHGQKNNDLLAGLASTIWNNFTPRVINWSVTNQLIGSDSCATISKLIQFEASFSCAYGAAIDKLHGIE